MDLNPLVLWSQMTILNKGVIVILICLSFWSLYVCIDRLIVFSKARKQSLLFARQATEHLKNDRPRTAIDAAMKYPRATGPRRPRPASRRSSSRARPATLSEVEVVEAATRAVERATLLTTSDMKRGIGSLATIATITPFIGLFGTVIGIINAFHGMALTGSGGIGAVSAGIAEALVATAFGLGVAIPAAWMFNYFTNVLERLQIEMSNSSSELIDFFMKRQRSKHAA